MKIAFRHEIGACISSSIDGTIGARQPELAPAVSLTVRVVSVDQTLY